MSLNDRLTAFAKEHRMSGKGPLSVALVVTRHAVRDGLPLNADKLLTDGGGQVAGLGKANVQAILKDHGIVRVLAANEHGLQEITVVAMESTQWARLQALLDNSTGDSP